MEMILASCGLDCAACPAYTLHKANDLAGLAAQAEKWSKEFGGSFTADNVRCEGCHAVGGKQIAHCAECGVRTCAYGKKHVTCAECAEFDACKTLADFIQRIPGARERLAAARA